MPDVSIVIPVRDEAGAIGAVLSGVRGACAALAAWEVIVVDDGSVDGTAEAVRQAACGEARIRLLRHPRAGGQSAAIQSGVRAARSPVICMLDGDGQNPAFELPRLWAPLLSDATGRLGLVAGQRVGRRDRAAKLWASRAANAIRSRALGDGTRDTGCGLKGFRRDAYLQLPYFDHNHRYLPALFRREGWEIRLIDVAAGRRIAGRSKYTNLGRALVGVVDLIGVAWLIRRRRTVTAREARLDSGPLAAVPSGAPAPSGPEPDLAPEPAR